MTASIEQVAAALRGSLLDGHPLTKGIGGTVLIEGLDPGRILEAWRVARAAVRLTGRWPVFTLPGDLYWEPTDADVADLATRARSVDPWSVFERYDDQWERDDWNVLDYVGTFLGAEVLADAPVGRTPAITQRELERWTYDRIVADPALTAAKQHEYRGLATTQRWMPWEEVQLVLLPTAEQWLAPAWIGYYGASTPGDGYGAWAAAMRQWQHRWGAELVAAWGTMLQFVVTRQPPPGEQAWQLADQHMALGQSLMMGLEQWQLACALSVGDAWFLHSRP